MKYDDSPPGGGLVEFDGEGVAGEFLIALEVDNDGGGEFSQV